MRKLVHCFTLTRTLNKSKGLHNNQKIDEDFKLKIYIYI